MPSRSANYAAVPSPKLRSQGVVPLRVSLVLAFVSSFCSFAAGSTPQTFLTLNSQPGDYIGQGITQTLTPADGTFSVTNTPDSVSISFHTPDYSQFWDLDFGSPVANKFGYGEYEGAQRTAFRSPTRPGDRCLRRRAWVQCGQWALSCDRFCPRCRWHDTSPR